MSLLHAECAQTLSDDASLSPAWEVPTNKMGLGPHAHTGSCCLVSRHLSTSEVAISLKDGLLHKLPILLRVKNWSQSACHFRHCFQCLIYLIW